MPRCSAASRYQSAQAVAAEAGEDHQVDVLHVRAFLQQVVQQAAEDGGFDLDGFEIGSVMAASSRRVVSARGRDAQARWAIMRASTLAQPRMTGSTPTACTARILDGKRIAEDLLDNLKAQVDARVAAGKPRPGLAVVLVGNDPASSVYVRNKRRAAQKVGHPRDRLRPAGRHHRRANCWP